LAAEEARLKWTPGLVANLIVVAALVGTGFLMMYYFSYKPLKAEGSAELDYVIHHFSLSSTMWWREFLALAFDILIIAVAIVGAWWTLGSFAAFAPEFRRWRNYYKSEEGKRDVWVEKFTLWQRIQHIWLFSTLIVCAYTGIVMNLGNNPYWKFLYFGSRDAFVKAHVISGLLMGVLLIFHFAYYGVRILISLIRREPVMEKYPILQFWRLWTFLKTLWGCLLWFVGLRPKRPVRDKYNPEELFEYWGVYWGILVLGIPGAFMAVFGPKFLNGVFWITHVKEAILAIVYLWMVHIASGHFRPTDFPINTTFIHGKMPLERVKDEHPLWYERLRRELGVAP